MPPKSSAPVNQFKVFLVVSSVLAIASWLGPLRQMPVDYRAMVWWSVPLACLWLVIFALSVLRFDKKSLWLVLGGAICALVAYFAADLWPAELLLVCALHLKSPPTIVVG